MKSRQAARASPDKGRATRERAQPLPTGRSPCRAGSPLGCGVRPIAGLSSRRRARRRRPGKGSSAKGRAKPLTARRSPSRAGSLLVYGPTQRWPARTKARQAARASPACAVKVAPGGEGVARQGSAGGEASAERRRGEKQSLPAGRSSGRAGSPPLVRGPAPAPVCAAEGARLQRRRQVRSERRTEGPSHAGEGAAAPNQAKPRSAREVSRVESCPEPACALECVPKAERRWRVPCLSKAPTGHPTCVSRRPARRPQRTSRRYCCEGTAGTGQSDAGPLSGVGNTRIGPLVWWLTRYQSACWNAIQAARALLGPGKVRVLLRIG